MARARRRAKRRHLTGARGAAEASLSGCGCGSACGYTGTNHSQQTSTLSRRSQSGKRREGVLPDFKTLLTSSVSSGCGSASSSGDGKSEFLLAA